MEEFQPLTQEEYAALDQVKEILKGQNTIPCTGCRYCVAGCPKGILIPDLFGCYNAKQIFQGWNSDFYYGVNTTDHGKAGDCIGCKQCERACPQHLPVAELLTQVAGVFEKTPAET